MKYQIKITRTEENDKFEAEVKQYESDNRYVNRLNREDRDYPQRNIITNVLLCELTEEQYKAVKKESFKVFE